MAIYNRAVHHAVFYIGVVSNVLQHPIPHTLVTPSIKTLIDSRTYSAASATALRCGLSKARLRRSGGIHSLRSRIHAGLLAEIPASFPIVRSASSLLSSDNLGSFAPNVNTTRRKIAK
jgi:hypothetical protein